jgi:hypothetical protein
MRQFDFTLGFAIMAENEIDARVKLGDLLKAISKDEIFKAMRVVDPDALTEHDAKELLDALDNFADSVDENVSGDFSEDIDQSLWDDYGKALEVLRFYGRRAPPSSFLAAKRGK